MTLTHRNAVSIAEIAVYVPCLIMAIILTIRHGFSKSAGWYFLVVFCLARIIGPAMQIASTSNPTSTALLTGSSILQNIGLSPLFLATLGLLSRLLTSINRTHKTLISTGALKFIELLLLVALILGIVGGINASGDVVKNHGVYVVPTISKVGSALFILCYVAIVASTILISFAVSHAEAGEKRILTAVAISLPFLLVRLIYSVISTFTHSKSFNLLSGSVVVLVCVALIEEFIIVLVYEGFGLTLHKVAEHHVASGHVEAQRHVDGGHRHVRSADSADYTTPQVRKQDNVALRIAKRTIVGRIVMSFVPAKDGDTEMEQRQRLRK